MSVKETSFRVINLGRIRRMGEAVEVADNFVILLCSFQLCW